MIRYWEADITIRVKCANLLHKSDVLSNMLFTIVEGGQQVHDQKDPGRTFVSQIRAQGQLLKRHTHKPRISEHQLVYRQIWPLLQSACHPCLADLCPIAASFEFGKMSRAFPESSSLSTENCIGIVARSQTRARTGNTIYMLEQSGVSVTSLVHQYHFC